MNRKFVKIVAIILAIIMVASVGYVLFAVVAGMLSAAATPIVATNLIKAAVPLLLAAA